MNFKVTVTVIMYGLVISMLKLAILALSLYITSSLVLGTVIIAITFGLSVIFGFIVGDNP